ncbi:HAD-superfamily hydrolase [Xylariaceae sp. FL0662B]|nr:HAD-superfamily hydrolase [Xylariaceae sp. FL0662B]
MARAGKETIAFAFDIDGVLMKGTKPVEGAREAIQELKRRNIPFVFLTNGGGLTEEAHVARLAQRLDLTLDTQQFVQSHTPYHDLVPEYGDKTVLALGGHGQQIRELAQAYGFKKVVTSSDVMMECEHIHPFPEMTRAHHDEHGRRGSDEDRDGLGATQISAILVWTSPRDWCLDLQLVGDLLLSAGGRLGTRSAKNGDCRLPNNGYLQDGQPKLFFCNPDFEWCTEHEHPRFAQGAFREALRGVWAFATRGRAHLEYTVLGKPSEATYVYAEKALRRYNEALAEGDGAPAPARAIRAVYMVGDNPESDIVGANTFKSRHDLAWKSVLVETGVHAAGSVPSHRPDHIARDVKEAVEWALQMEGVGINGDCVTRQNGDSRGASS